jgi:hypothetical protein
VPLRAVFLGTTDVQPALKLQADAILISRAKTALTHVSTLRTLPGESDDVTVKVKTFGFNTAVGQSDHDLVAKLVRPNDTEITATVSSVQVEPDGSAVHTFVFAPSPTVTSYRVKLTGSRSGGSVAPFVVVERLDIAT